MRILFTNSTLNIKDGMTVSGVSNRREILSVLRGKLWLTVEGSTDDYWLDAGDNFTVEPDKLVVIEAFRGDGQILLSHEQDEAAEDEPRRAFDFFKALPQNPLKTADLAATEPQFGYTGDLCQQQKPQIRPQLQQLPQKQQACPA
ncbi:MAG TPA: DUF2917 domain-containing protein [Burkholderiaceae bacterium]